MSAEIVALPGADVPVDARTAPCQEVVEALEDLLKKAKEGRVRAIAVAVVENCELTGEGWYPSEHSFSHQMMASISDLQFRYARSRAGRSAYLAEGEPA